MPNHRVTGSDLQAFGSACADSMPAAEQNIADTADQDTWLAFRIRHGERAAEQELARRFSRPLYASALRLCRHPATAEDLVGDTLLKLIVELREAPPRSDLQLMAYALGVVRGLSANLTAKAHRQRTDSNLAAVDQLESGLPSPERQADSGLVRDRLATLVRNLPVHRDRLLLTRLMAGVAEQAIRHEFGWSQPQWQKACSRAIQRLRQAAGRELADFGG